MCVSSFYVKGVATLIEDTIGIEFSTHAADWELHGTSIRSLTSKWPLWHRSFLVPDQTQSYHEKVACWSDQPGESSHSTGLCRNGEKVLQFSFFLKKTILPSSPLSQGQEQGKMDAPAHKQRSTDHFSYYIFVTFRISIDWMGPSHWSRWIFLKWSINSNAISSRKCFTEVLFHYLPGHPLTQGSCHMKLVIVEREKNSLSTYFLNVKMKMFLIKLQEKAFPSKAS